MALTPTLWRTCRALANRRRLRLLQRLMTSSPSSVSDIAQDMRMPVAVVSQYLRALNARGLLRVKRQGRYVFYEAGADPAMPPARVLLNALRTIFKSADPINKAYEALTAFTHPRRISLLKVLTEGPATPERLRLKTGISRQAFSRHIKKLRLRGCVTKTGQMYQCARPSMLLIRSLMALVRES